MKHLILALLAAIAMPAFSEEVANFATEEECRMVAKKIDQTYATIQDYNGAALYMSGQKVVNIDCGAKITSLTYDRWGYVSGAKFKSEPKMIVETVAEFNSRLDRLVNSRDSRDLFLRNRAANSMKKYGL